MWRHFIAQVTIRSDTAQSLYLAAKLHYKPLQSAITLLQQNMQKQKISDIFSSSRQVSSTDNEDVETNFASGGLRETL